MSTTLSILEIIIHSCIDHSASRVKGEVISTVHEKMEEASVRGLGRFLTSKRIQAYRLRIAFT